MIFRSSIAAVLGFFATLPVIGGLMHANVDTHSLLAEVQSSAEGQQCTTQDASPNTDVTFVSCGGFF